MSAPGTEGYCKLCESKWLPDINQKIGEGWNARQVADWLTEASEGQFSFNRQTFYGHRDNKGGKHRLGTFATRQRTTEESDAPGVPAPKTTNDDFLEFIRDEGMRTLQEHPGQITPKMALEAVKILEARKTGVTNVLVLARVLTGQVLKNLPLEPEAIEGEYREVPALPGPIEQEVAVT